MRRRSKNLSFFHVNRSPFHLALSYTFTLKTSYIKKLPFPVFPQLLHIYQKRLNQKKQSPKNFHQKNIKNSHFSAQPSQIITKNIKKK